MLSVAIILTLTLFLFWRIDIISIESLITKLTVIHYSKVDFLKTKNFNNTTRSKVNTIPEFNKN
jgi:hypothetical protein